MLYLGTRIQLLLRLLLLLLLLLWILLLFPPVPSVTGGGVPYKFALHAVCETGRGVPCSLVVLCAILGLRINVSLSYASCVS